MVFPIFELSYFWGSLQDTLIIEQKLKRTKERSKNILFISIELGPIKTQDVKKLILIAKGAKINWRLPLLIIFCIPS